MFKDLSQGQTHYQNDGCGEKANNDIVKTCTGLNCPERTGGECTAGQKLLEQLQEKMEKEFEGELYPCEPNIFEKTYEPVEETNT